MAADVAGVGVFSARPGVGEKEPRNYADYAGKTHQKKRHPTTLGEIQWNYHLSLPLSRVYFNPRTKVWNYLVFNPTAQSQTATVFKDGAPIGTISAPPRVLTVASKLN